MKKTMFGILPVIAMGSVFLGGCASPHQEMVVTRYNTPVTTTRTTVVTEAPPTPRVEVEGPAPSTAHVWIQGYWTYIDNRWVWSPGHWDLRPRMNAAWVPGEWDKDPTGKGWLWTPGHWE